MTREKQDHVALWMAAGLGTFTNLILNFGIWEGLYFFRHRLGIHLEAINYQLSVWPVLVDIVILMASMAIAYQQMRQQDAQGTILQAMHILIGKMDAVLGHMQENDTGDAQDLDRIVAFIDLVGPQLDKFMASHKELDELVGMVMPRLKARIAQEVLRDERTPPPIDSHGQDP